MFRRSKSERLYDDVFHLLPGDSVVVAETTEVEGGLLKVTNERFRHMATQAETIRVRLDKLP